MNATPVTCPLCDTPEHLPGMWNCECQYDRRPELDAALAVHADKTRLREARARHERRFRLDLPPRYAAYVDTPFPRAMSLENVEVMKRVVAPKPGALIYLHGQGGRGKTHFAVRLAHSLVSETCGPRFVSEIDWFDHEMRRARGDDFTDFLAADVLVLDDVGRRRANEFAVERLYALLEYRWAHCLTTIFTSNLSPEEAVSRLTSDDVYSGGILSRLTSGCVGELVGTVDGREGSAL